MKPLLLVSALFVACAPPSQCVTRCGVRIVADNLEHACEGYAATEYALLQRIEGVLPDACTSWNGLYAFVVPGDYTPTIDGTQQMGGWTFCDGALYFHEHGRLRSYDTAFAHELIHVAQQCSTPAPVDDGTDADHANWVRLGLFRALANTKTELHSKGGP